MTHFRGIGGPSFQGPTGPNGNNNPIGGPQNAQPGKTPGFNVGPSADAVSFSTGLPAASSPSHNVNFSAISQMTMAQAKDQLHGTTFGAMSQLF